MGKESDSICLEYKLLRSLDFKKDQSFFLCHLTKSVLPFVEFPVGAMMKSEVKQLAQELNLDRIAQKDESNGMMNSNDQFLFL